MIDTARASRPLLVVVAGRPGAGKTTLAHRLAGAIRCPAICRDEIKEGFVLTTGDAGEPGDKVARDVYDTFFETVELLLKKDVSTVAEAAFQHKLWAARLEPLLKTARVRIVLCDVDPELARARHAARGAADPEREQIHPTSAPTARGGVETPAAEWQPPRLNVPTLKVDTTDGYAPALDEIVAFALD